MAKVNIPTKNVEQDSKTLLRAIFDQRYQLAGVLSPEGVLIDANQRALNFAGVELKDVVGRLFWETPWWSHSAGIATTNTQCRLSSLTRRNHQL